MKTYIGTKTIKAEPMVLGEFINTYNRDPYANQHGSHPDTEEGYCVQYEDGYISWSPKASFEKAYRVSETFIDRMKIELDNLSEKCDKLNKFIDENPKFQELCAPKQELMTAQLSAMFTYAKILEIRWKIAMSNQED